MFLFGIWSSYFSTFSPTKKYSMGNSANYPFFWLMRHENCSAILFKLYAGEKLTGIRIWKLLNVFDFPCQNSLLRCSTVWMPRMSGKKVFAALSWKIQFFATSWWPLKFAHVARMTRIVSRRQLSRLSLHWISGDYANMKCCIHMEIRGFFPSDET